MQLPSPRVVVVSLFVVAVVGVTAVNLLSDSGLQLTGQEACITPEICTVQADCEGVGKCPNLTCNGVTFTCVSASSSSCGTPSAPGTPDLLAQNDLGQNSTDNITKITTPIFTGTCADNNAVKLYSGSTLMRTVVCGVSPLGAGYYTASGSFATTSLTINYSVTATQTNSCGGASAASSALTVTIDTVAPTASSYSPTDGATGVSATSNFTLTLSENGYASGGTLTVYSSTGAWQTITATDTGKVTVSSATVTIVHYPLQGSAAYYMNIAARALGDIAGNVFAGILDATTWNFTTTSVCGDGTVSGSEECESGACCNTGTCAFYTTATTCRASAGTCDVAESCTGSSTTCPSDSFQSASTVCRTSAGSCDVVENCTGSAAACPSDTVATAGTVCLAVQGVCDIPDTCDGSNVGCTAAYKSAGTACTGGCCSGSAATCPTSCTAACGDGVVTAGEACDDGNTNNADGCSNTCTEPSCGNGVREGTETCDDGSNNGPGKGCSSTCTVSNDGGSGEGSGGDGGVGPPPPPVFSTPASEPSSESSSSECDDGQQWEAVPGEPGSQTVWTMISTFLFGDDDDGGSGGGCSSSSSAQRMVYCLNAQTGKWFDADGVEQTNPGPVPLNTCLSFTDTDENPVVHFKQPQVSASFKLRYCVDTVKNCYETEKTAPTQALQSGCSKDVPAVGGVPLPACI